MLMAGTHMAGSAHSSISPPPCWHPVVLVPSHQQQHHQALYDRDLVTPSPFPTTPAATASPARHNHDEQQHLRLPASRRRAGKPRRPRPSRKLPTTYIRVDAASFRRMVHQVTGADDVVQQHQDTTEELLCRPTTPPSARAALTTTTTMLMPTLDTSAFLLGATARGAGAGGGGGATPARSPGASCCHGSAVAVGDPGAALQAEEACRSGGAGGGGEYSCSNGRAAAGGFRSLESWDDDAIFQE